MSKKKPSVAKMRKWYEEQKRKLSQQCNMTMEEVRDLELEELLDIEGNLEEVEPCGIV